MVDTNKIIGISYIIIQVTLALFISIVGAVHVRRCINEQKQQIELNTAVELNEKKTDKEAGDNKSDNTSDKEDVTGTITEDSHETKQTGFIGLWARTIWKMRSVYSGLAVHCFDVLTDILVIIQWLNLPDDEVDNVNPQIMAYCGIAVVLGSKVISSIAIFLKEGDIRRAALQFIDLLIFEEIYESHKKIISQIKNKKSIKAKQTAIESTLSFKYVRNMEAIFESIPEAVLQLVYVMRVGMSHVGTSHFIFIVSIIQSIVSMTNSILNNDHTMMKEDKWKEYKQRLPPSFKFLKHAICRISEIVYRIGLLALFWTVCEGRAFAVLLGIELVLICVRVGWLLAEKEITFDADTILLGLSSVVVIPSEEVYGIATYEWHQMFGSVVDADDGIMDNAEMCTVVLCANICCCTGAASALASIPGLLPCDFYTGPKISFPPIIRIGTSLNEIIFLVIWAFVGDNESRITFLLDTEHGLVIFIVTCVCFVIFSQYRILFPDFSLPLDVNVRSKWGYAYSNELTELQKIKVPLKRKATPKDQDMRSDAIFQLESRRDFWDEPYTFYEDNKPLTAAMFALAKGNHEIVQWLEDQGAILHKNADSDMFTRFIFISTRGKYE
eukprot:252901_1